MIVSSSAPAMGVPSVIEVRWDGSRYVGIEATDFCDNSGELASRISASFRPLLLNSSDIVVPTQFVGLTIEHVGLGNNDSVHPIDLGVACGYHRCLGQGSYWAEIEKAPGVYDFSKLRAALVAAKARGCKTIWNIAYTPTFYASDVSAHRTSGYPTSGWPTAPKDLAATMQANPADNSTSIRNLCIAAMQAVGDVLDAVVWWNEPGFVIFNGTNAPAGNWKDSSNTGDCADWTTVRASVSGDQDFVQFVLCQACAYAVIKALCPWITFIGCDLYGEQSSQGTGGKQAGTYSLGKWFDAGGGDHCDAYGWHGYCDLYQLTGITGVNHRLAELLQGIEQKRIDSGAPARPWYCTEFGYNNLGALPVPDQKAWVKRNVATHASLGFRSCIAYCWDSRNPVTAQMSWWNKNAIAGYAAGLQPVVDGWNEAAALFSGSTIAAGSRRLSDGRWCGTVNGVKHVI